MKASDLRERTTEDLLELERSLSLERFQNRFKNFTNRLDDTSLIRKNRRDLARVKGILSDRVAKLAEAQAAKVVAEQPAAAAEEAKPEKAAAVEQKPTPPEVKASGKGKSGSSKAKPAAEAGARAVETATQQPVREPKPSSKKRKPAGGEGESK